MKIFLMILLILIIIYLITTYMMFILISKKTAKELLPMSKNVEKALLPYKTIREKGVAWINNKPKEDIMIKSKDNLDLHAILIEHKKPNAIMIELHGYRSTANRDLFPSCHEYYKLGYSLLIPDMRCCGLSEGKYITFGIKESKDLLEWIKYCNKRFPNTQIILAGISMGASTILMTLDDLNLRNNVKLVLVDSAYNDPIEEINYCIKTYFHLNGKLFIKMINNWCKWIAHFNLKDKNVLKSIKDIQIPILWIHGLNDSFVPYENSKVSFNYYNGPKELLLIDNAEHGMSYLIEPDKYVKTVKDFMERNKV